MDPPAQAPAMSLRGLTLDPAAFTVNVKGRTASLSPRELELLTVLMQNAGRVLSFELLMDQVWHRQESRDYRSVKTHVLRLRRKIEPDPHAPTFIRTVRGVGYVFDRRPLAPAQRPRPRPAAGPLELGRRDS